MSSSYPGFRFADLFAGIGGFHSMLDHAGGRCVFVSEIDAEARGVYERNWLAGSGDTQPVVNSDIRVATPEVGALEVPEHDVLAAGFPCQPFSKSGSQLGMDEARGTLFWNIARVLESERPPSVVLLENVRNLTGPRHKHEWDVIIQTLREKGYRVSSTPTVFSPHLLPPSLGGTPQVRDRVFILGTYVGRERALAEDLVPPTVARRPVDPWRPEYWDVDWVLDDDDTIPSLGSYKLNADELLWVGAWDVLVQQVWAEAGKRLPGFPLWYDEWRPKFAFEEAEWADLPAWKSDFMRKNDSFYVKNVELVESWKAASCQNLLDDLPDIPRAAEWRSRGLKSIGDMFRWFPASRRKLEWQAQDTKSLWDTVMHFRPSGVRAKAPTYLPALVAITQTSVVGSRKRRLTPHEAARLQGLPRSFSFGGQKNAASYKQVGNGVAVGAAWHVFKTHVLRDQADLPAGLVESVKAAERTVVSDAVSIAGHLFEEELRARKQ